MAAGRARKASPPREIEGEVVVLERKAREAGPTMRIEPAEPLNDNRADPPQPFPEHRRSRPDFLYPGAVRWRAVPHARATIFRRLPGRRKRLQAAIGAALLAACFGTIWQKVPPSAAAAPERPAFVLTETASTTVIRGRTRALFVEGRIRNASNRPAAPPAVVVRLGGTIVRSFQPARSIVSPGASVFFHSTLALPSDTSDAKAVLSLEAAAAQGHS